MQNIVLIVTGPVGVEVPPGVRVIYNNTAIPNIPLENSPAIDLEIADPVTKSIKKLSALKKEMGMK